MPEILEHEEILSRYDREQHNLRIFMDGVVSFIGQHPQLNLPAHAAVHSYKSRLKDREHLRVKIGRKIAMGRDITVDNLFSEITDLAGVRIPHLFQDDFQKIDTVIRSRVQEEYWYFGERPKAYTRDLEAAEFFKTFDLDVVQKTTLYNIVNYLLRPGPNSQSFARFKCERYSKKFGARSIFRLTTRNQQKALHVASRSRCCRKSSGQEVGFWTRYEGSITLGIRAC